MNLGRYPEAVDALRYGRGLSPTALHAYDGLTIAYNAMGNLHMAAVTLEARAQLDRFQPAALAAIRELYRQMPDASCAFVQDALNPGCPRVKTDLCQSLAELAQAFDDARQPEQAGRQNAARSWGCPGRASEILIWSVSAGAVLVLGGAGGARLRSTLFHGKPWTPRRSSAPLEDLHQPPPSAEVS